MSNNNKNIIILIALIIFIVIIYFLIYKPPKDEADVVISQKSGNSKYIKNGIGDENKLMNSIEDKLNNILTGLGIDKRIYVIEHETHTFHYEDKIYLSLMDNNKFYSYNELIGNSLDELSLILRNNITNQDIIRKHLYDYAINNGIYKKER